MFLVFCSSFVPMMVMTIAACYNTTQFTKFSSALGFGIVVLLADAVPIAFQAVNLALSANNIEAVVSKRYIFFSFALYLAQILLTLIAVWLLQRRLAVSSKTAQSDKSQRNLRRFLMFSIAPNLILVMFAVSEIMLFFRGNSQFMMDLDTTVSDVQQVVFAMKPTIDALSTLLFLGEYRQHLTAAGLSLGRWLVEKCQRPPARVVTIEPSRTNSWTSHTRASHLHRQAAHSGFSSQHAHA
ncbi:hypothetical protein AAVH_27872 [Aphelenchoides avenae]|nr:hypothetical protein AAVH_27872 [Aphelenchus avenae]